MAAFNFPEPPVENGTEVTNDSTGVTYKYNAVLDTWSVVSTNTVEDIDDQISTLSGEISRIDGEIGTALDERDELLEDQVASNAEQNRRIDALEESNVTYVIGTDKVTRIGEPAIELVDSKGYYSNVKFSGTGGIEVTSDLQSIIIDGSKIDADVDLSRYYTKDEIDTAFSLRGVGGIWLLSSFNGTPTIREGEFHTDNRLAGQITKLSIAPVDDKGKLRRDVVSGDTIELYNSITDNFYRYEITQVVDGNYTVIFRGSNDQRNDTFGTGWTFTIYFYPTHISPDNYYTKAQIDALLSARALENEVDQNEEQLQAVSTSLLRLINKVDDLEGLDIQNALSTLAIAIQDIIELKSKVSSLEHTFSLHLE